MKKHKLGLIIAMLIWGSIGIFVKHIDFTSSQIALLRAIIGSIFLIVFSVFSKEYLSKEKTKNNLVVLILCGICLGFNWIFLFQAYNYTTISTATICYYLAPIIVMFLSPLILKERLSLIKVICIIVAMMGMFCIVGIESNNLQGKNIIGILYGVGAACLYAGVIILNKFLKGISGKESSTIQLLIAGIFLMPYVFFTDGMISIDSKFSSVLFIIILGIIHTGVAYLIYFTVIQKLPGQTTALYSYIDPISAIIMSSILLNEKMRIMQIIGGILVLGSTFISEIYTFKREKVIIESDVMEENNDI